MRIWLEKQIFYEGFSWFKFNKFGLALGIALKFHTSVAKERVETKIQKVFGLIPRVVEVTGKNLE